MDSRIHLSRAESNVCESYSASFLQLILTSLKSKSGMSVSLFNWWQWFLNRKLAKRELNGCCFLLFNWLRKSFSNLAFALPTMLFIILPVGSYFNFGKIFSSNKKLFRVKIELFRSNVYESKMNVVKKMETIFLFFVFDSETKLKWTELNWLFDSFLFIVQFICFLSCIFDIDPLEKNVNIFEV